MEMLNRGSKVGLPLSLKSYSNLFVCLFVCGYGCVWVCVGVCACIYMCAGNDINVCQIRQQRLGEVKWAGYEDETWCKIKDALLWKFGTKGSNREKLDRNTDKSVAKS